MSSLEGKVAVVTGAGQGLGRAQALGLAARGAFVIVNDVGRSSGASHWLADRVVDEIHAAGGKAQANRADVSDWESGRLLIEQALEATGALDILVCNAGIERSRMVFNMSEAEWDDVIRVHMKGHFVPTRFAASHWRERSRATGSSVDARLIFTSSEAGLFGHAGHLSYCASKAGIAGMTLACARELASYGVTVNCISPRARTPMALASFPQIAAPPGDAFDPWDARCIIPWLAFLCGPDAARITGQLFVVYGGVVQWMKAWGVHAEISQGRLWDDASLLAAARRMLPDLTAGLDPMPELWHIPTPQETPVT